MSEKKRNRRVVAPNLRILIHIKEMKENTKEEAPIRDKTKRNQERKSTVPEKGRTGWPELREVRSHKIAKNGDNTEVREAIKVKKGKKGSKKPLKTSSKN